METNKRLLTKSHKYQVNKTALLVSLLEKRLKLKEPLPLAGDIVICKCPEKVYDEGHLNLDNPERHSAICVRPYVPFVFANDGESGVHFSTSGGYWLSAPKKEMLSYVGVREKTFKAWGFYGPCADGAFTFTAKVNAWEIFLDSIY